MSSIYCMYIDHVTKSMNKYHLLYSGSFEILFHYLWTYYIMRIFTLTYSSMPVPCRPQSRVSDIAITGILSISYIKWRD